MVDPQGESDDQIVEAEREPSEEEVAEAEPPPARRGRSLPRAPALPVPSAGTALIQSVEEHTAKASAQVANLRTQLAPRPDLPKLRIPQLKMTTVTSEFSLADITDLAPFRHLGERIAADPAGSLRRIAVRSQIVTGADGLRRTELVTARALDRIESPASLLPLDDLRQRLLEHVLGAPIVPARANQRRPAAEIVEAFLQGLGTHAETILSGYMDRAVAGLLQLVTEEQRGYVAKPTYGQVVEVMDVAKVRPGRLELSRDRYGPFGRGVGYDGYQKSLYAQDWFDSSTERAVANMLEDEEDIVLWVRLQIGDLPILWTGAREYHPDFIAVDGNNVHWLVEAKMDKEMASDDVQGKRDAARRWANYVSADDAVGVVWRYLLVSESDVAAAKGFWDVLKKLGGQ